jgi:hypothetical protein
MHCDASSAELLMHLCRKYTLQPYSSENDTHGLLLLLLVILRCAQSNNFVSITTTFKSNVREIFEQL